MAAAIFAIVLYVNYLNSTTDVSIKYKNVSDVKVKDITESTHEHGESQDIKKDSFSMSIDVSGKESRLYTNHTYLISYKPNDGYSQEEIKFSPKNRTSINIDPHYSVNKLNSILEGEFESIKTALYQKYPQLHLYEIQKGKLYYMGEWYGTTLRYVGDDYDNSDTLRVVLKKSEDNWQVVTDPPSITLDKYTYKNIPFDILTDVNNFQKTPILERLTNPQMSHDQRR